MRLNLVFLLDFNQNVHFFFDRFSKYPLTNFVKKLVPWDQNCSILTQTDEQICKTGLTVVYCDLSNALKNHLPYQTTN